jgi:antitoxin CptB
MSLRSNRLGPPTPPEVLRRLRWRSRRGMLENDLLIGRFLDQHGKALDASEAAALGSLLELPDPELFELLLGRGQLPGRLDLPAIQDVVMRLRAVRLESVSTRSSTPQYPHPGLQEPEKWH